MKDSFIHLDVHSEYSITKGMIQIEDLITTAARMQMPAVAVTDTMNVFAAIKFYQEAIKHGIKPIIGCELAITDESQQGTYYITVLCKTNEGYNNLLKLLSMAYTMAKTADQAVVSFTSLCQHKQGLLVLSGSSSDIGKLLLEQQSHAAMLKLAIWQEHFPNNYYLSISRRGAAADDKLLKQTMVLAHATNTPVVATNAPMFLMADEYKAHCARVCISQGKVLAQYDSSVATAITAGQYFKSSEAMYEMFGHIPASLANTVAIAKRCTVNLNLNQVVLPDFPIPVDYTVDTYLAKIAKSGLQQKLSKLFNENISAEDKATYYDRLSHELSVITKMGYAGYFLIVYDFIKWSKSNNIPVGPGRGSGAGSLVAFAMDITDIDPIEYDLLFERFLNPERVSMPDFDIDFCIEGRDRVINYVSHKYGKENVAQIITFGTLAAKAVIRDVGRVLGHPYGLVDKIAKLIPLELGITLKKALKEPELQQKYKQDETAKAIIDLAIPLEGVVRNAGKHAGGVVIASGAITDFAPVYRDSLADNLVTQYDKDDAEKVGLIKFDLLGLKTLTVIDHAVSIINDSASTNELVDLSKLTNDDSKTYELICACDTTSVFQLESRGMKDLISRLQPDKFGDIVALVALFRPGPLQSGMVDDFINRKHGVEAVSYIHPDLEPILASTYGVILYQEQVMEIARKIGGYTLGKADLLRRAMGKKKPKEMAMQRSIFMQGAIDNGLSNKLATTIFDLMEKFSGYGFNKSHSAAYALLSYQTGWLKANYRAEFMAAVMSADMENTDKLFSLISECKQHGLVILPPSVNDSQYKFTIDNGAIRYGLGAIKGIGKGVVEDIINQRARKAYVDIYDFTNRTAAKKLSKKTIDSLAYSGALDCLAANRAMVISTVNHSLELSDRHEQDKQSGQANMFAMDNKTLTRIIPETSTLDMKEYLQGELDSLGFYFSLHPLDFYRKDIAANPIMPINKIENNQHLEKITIAGVITAIKRVNTRKGIPLYFVTIDDGLSMADITVFDDIYQQDRELVIKDNIISVTCNITKDNNNTLRLRAIGFQSLREKRKQNCHSVELIIEQQISKQSLEKIQEIISSQPKGGCAVMIIYANSDWKGTFKMSQQISPEPELFWQLADLLGDKNVNLNYSKET